MRCRKVNPLDRAAYLHLQLKLYTTTHARLSLVWQMKQMQAQKKGCRGDKQHFPLDLLQQLINTWIRTLWSHPVFPLFTPQLTVKTTASNRLSTGATGRWWHHLWPIAMKRQAAGQAVRMEGCRWKTKREQRTAFNLCFAELSGSCQRCREGKKRVWWMSE